jgi:hypothetical protein
VSAEIATEQCISLGNSRQSMYLRVMLVSLVPRPRAGQEE